MNLEEQFLVERYKYILSQKQSLNDITFKVVALYQVGAFALIGAEYGIIYRRACNSAELLQDGSTAVVLGLFALSVFSVLFICVGVRSWMRYRLEESNLETMVHGTPCRPPVGKSFLRWYETYIVAIIIIVLSGMVFWRIEVVPEMILHATQRCPTARAAIPI